MRTLYSFSGCVSQPVGHPLDQLDLVVKSLDWTVCIAVAKSFAQFGKAPRPVGARDERLDVELVGRFQLPYAPPQHGASRYPVALRHFKHWTALQIRVGYPVVEPLGPLGPLGES